MNDILGLVIAALAGECVAEAPELRQTSDEGVASAAVERADRGTSTVPNRTFEVLFGVFSTGYLGETITLTQVGYEPNFVVALVRGHDVCQTSQWRIGVESGIALRFGAGRVSVETWQGTRLSMGYHGPTIVTGRSSVTNSIGVEARRAAEVEGGSAVALNYLGIEATIARGSPPFPTLVYRLHHRSGNLFGADGMAGSLNVNSIGLQFRY